MIFEPRTGIAIVSHQRLKEDAVALKEILQKSEIELEPNSVLAQAIDNAIQLAAWSENPALIPRGHHAPTLIRTIVGMSFLTRVLIHSQRDPNALVKLRKHFDHLRRDNPIPTDPLEKGGTSRDFIFEMIIGGLFMSAGFDVAMAAEPDVTVTRSGKWNFACKLISSLESNTVGENLAKGWKQVLRSQFQGDYGMVIMGLGKRLNQGLFLPVLDEAEDYWATFKSIDDPKELLLEALEALSKQILSQAKTRIDDQDKRFRGVVLVAQTVTSYNRSPVLLTALKLITREDLFGTGVFGPEQEMIVHLNEEAQTVFTR